MTAAGRKRIGEAQKRRWAAKRADKLIAAEAKKAPKAARRRAYTVRVISQGDSGGGLETRIDQHRIKSWGQFVDLVTGYDADIIEVNIARA